MANKIFISYRRDDAAAWAGRLYMALEKHFDKSQLFMDVDHIRPGSDFVKVLEDQVAQCDVLLAVIGKGWMTAANAKGERRLDDPGDYVRIEIESALKRDVHVIPVLVDGAQMPRAEELPESLRALARRQAWPLSHARFGPETDQLAKSLTQQAPVESKIEPRIENSRQLATGESISRLFMKRFLFLAAALALLEYHHFSGSHFAYMRYLFGSRSIERCVAHGPQVGFENLSASQLGPEDCKKRCEADKQCRAASFVSGAMDGISRNACKLLADVNSFSCGFPGYRTYILN